MLKSLSQKILSVIIISFLCSFTLMIGLIYYSIYNQTKESAGIEAYGCANITTGLIDPSLLEKALNGDSKAQEKLSKTINWTVQHKKLFDSHYILDLDGNIIAADKNMLKEGARLGNVHPIDKKLLKDVANMKHPMYSEIYVSNGEKTLTGLAPIFKDHDPTKEVIAINAIDFDASIIAERAFDTIKTSILGLFIPLLFVLIATFIFVNKITKPIKVVSNKVNEVSKGDLTAEIDIKNKNDEIGALANDFNSLIKRFKDILGEVLFNTTTLAATSEELFASSQNVSSISNHNSKRLEEINEMARTQSEHMTKINEIVQMLSERIQTISEQINNFASVSLKTVEDAETGVEVVNRTNEQIHNIDSKIEKLTSTMISLQSKSKEIDQITKIINDISEQTNILSFNATIEAERAGEYGKGFSVVAEEIRKLAEESSNSTKKIDELLNQIQKEINDALMESEEGRKETKEGIKKAKEVEDTFRNISRGIKEVTSDLTSTSQYIQQISSELKEIVEKMDEVLKLIENTASNTHDVTSAINEQNNSFKEIVNITESLSELSEELKEKIKYFKINK